MGDARGRRLPRGLDHRGTALVVQGGINDVAQGRSTDDAAERLEAMIGRGLALGLAVAVCDVLPWNNGGPEQRAAIDALNGRIRSLAVPLLPFHDNARGSGAARHDEGRVGERRRRSSVDRWVPPPRGARVPLPVLAAVEHLA